MSPGRHGAALELLVRCHCCRFEGAALALSRPFCLSRPRLCDKADSSLAASFKNSDRGRVERIPEEIRGHREAAQRKKETACCAKYSGV